MLERLQSALRSVKESKRNYSLHFSLHISIKYWKGVLVFGAVFSLFWLVCMSCGVRIFCVAH